MNIQRASLQLIGTGVVLGIAALAAQQEKPPVIVHGFNGTLVLEGTVDQEYQGGHAILVKTADGLRHLVHLNDHTAVHGGKSADPLRDLEVGTPIVVHYVSQGEAVTAIELDRIADDGLQTAEGVVNRVDRRAKILALRLEDGSLVTLRLTDRAAADVGKQVGETDRVIVYYTDDQGNRVAHFFKRLSK